MAGKSNKGRNRKGPSGTANAAKSAAGLGSNNAKPELKELEAPRSTCETKQDSGAGIGSNESESELKELEVAGPIGEPKQGSSGSANAANSEDGIGSNDAESELKESEVTGPIGEPKQGELHLYNVPVKTQNGDQLELQLNPGDNIMDVRQFLLDAPETCFFTCYDLLLHTKDGSTHHLEDYNEISDVADISLGGCSFEMVAAPYDDRSIRAHVHHTRELLSLSTAHSSLSTSLALEYEKSQSKTIVSGNTKPEVPELDGLGCMEDVAGSLGKLLSAPSKEIKCVERIVFSSLNPPPSYRRLVGDLIYMDVVTLEGNRYCITGTTKMFYVNSSTGLLDPRPSQAGSDSTTLIGLLQKISSKFRKSFHEIIERKASAHPFENVQSLLPPNSWLGPYPIPEHKRDAARAEDALTLSFGSELIGMQRDWNEELQSCREFPHTSSQERMLRDRALYKVTSDFVDAATSGAIGVISRCIPPINSTDPECFHMYVHNNIFFSFAVDADIEQSRKGASNTDLNNESAASPSLSRRGDNVSHGDHVNSNDVACDGLKLSDGDDGTESSQSSAVTQVAESEQATYASANNDLKGTKAYQEADISGLYNLAMAIIDYRGHRVVAQSVLPGILQGDKSDSLLYGSVDNGKKICWNEGFHSKVLEAAKRLHIKEHAVFDAFGNVVKLAAPVECKGIVGSDDRHYLLDLMRVTPRDANYTGPGSRFCVLRPELIAAFYQAEMAERSKSKSEPDREVQRRVDSFKASVVDAADMNETNTSAAFPSNQDEKKISEAKEHSSPGECLESDEEILFNPNVFTEFKLAGDPEEIANDEKNVRKASSYLVDTVLPKFIQDLCTLEVSPMDGRTLTEALHAHGINVRYIGKVANGTKHLPHLWDLCSNEIVVRSAKHIMKDILRETEDHDVGPAISHFLNCFFGSCQSLSKGATDDVQLKTEKKDQSSHKSPSKSSKGQQRWKVAHSKKNHSSYMILSSELLWSDIMKFAKLKYQFELQEDARVKVKQVSVLRNLCQKVGITVAAHKYDLNAATPFKSSDIMDLLPVVKHSVPVCSEAKELVETGKVQLAEGMLNEAYSLFSEAFSILQQVTGPMHREVANCCRYLAMVLYHAGDMGGAIIEQHKELIINERCLGLDHPDTAHSYGNMALFYHGLNQSELALRHMSCALLLLSLSSGPDHPDVAATFINVAMMYQDIGKMETALRYLQEALKKNERLLGAEHIQTAVCYHALAIAFNCMGAFKLSHQHEKKTYDILVKQLGEDDSRTRDSENWMKTFKMRELQMNAQKQKGQALNAASAQKALDILKANPDLMHAVQSAAVAGGSGTSGNKLRNAALVGDALPRGRGVDERAARAVAEVRKKAAAKGLSIRPHGVPVQAVSPLTQLLNIINAGGAPDAPLAENGEANGIKKESESKPSNGAVDVKKDQPSSQEDQAPLGLGKGLALDAKKQKAKDKDAA